jgi:Trk-type K+ transport system membrane component
LRQDRHIDQFRPSVLMGSFGSFVVWMLLLLFGFGVVAHALGGWFSPPADFDQALFIVGSALCTVGLSGIEANGPARWVLIASGLCGLAVLTGRARRLGQQPIDLIAAFVTPDKRSL